MLRYRRLRRAAALSRCLLESLAALALLSWSSDRLPAALAHCACLLRRLPAVILHPLPAFVLGNAIVVALLAKSGNAHSADDPPPSRRAVADVARPGSFDVYDNLGYFFNPLFSAQPPPQLQWKGEEEEEEEEDKAACVETTTAACVPKKGRPESEPEMGLRLRRVKSEDLAGAVTDRYTERKLLFRSATDLGARQKVVPMSQGEEQGGEEGGGGVAVVVADDGAEFRRKIEAFISKQLRFIEREEEELLFAEVTK